MKSIASSVAALVVLAGVGWASLTIAATEQDKAAADKPFELKLRTRVEPFKGSGHWVEARFSQSVNAKETAILICDMWDKHWCEKASERCGVMAKKMAVLVGAARAQGVSIIHAPSECMDFYKGTPQRTRPASLPQTAPPKDRSLADPPLSIDDSDGGCDSAEPSKSYRAWTRQHPAIPIGENDIISDNGKEIYSFLQSKGIKNLLVMGVHTNMCVLGRSFGIRQMTRWGVPCVLVRDMTDSMYNPARRPMVSHDEGTALVVEHIEKYWCPTTTSSELMSAFGEAKPSQN